MDMLWPTSLLLMVLIPVLVAGYIWLQRRRRRFAVRYSSLSLVRAALPHQSWLRRHLPFALFLAALASLVLALGRPVTITLLPAGQATVILSIDISRSMLQDDIPPSRLEAAEQAALSFIKRRTSNTQIGIVAFAGWAQLLQNPTTDQDALQRVVQGLTTGRGTAIGSGIIEALEAIAEVNGNVAPVERGSSAESPPDPVPTGAYVPDIIVLLTDGVRTTGPMPLDAAQLAADRGVRVYTVGFGTEHGSPGMFSWGGGRFRRGLDEETLKEIAALTGGEYYFADSADELIRVFESLPTHLMTREETTEVTFAFAAAGALLALLAAGLQLVWHPLH